MKKVSVIILLVSVVFFSKDINAQEFTYGVQGGVNFAVQSSIGNIYDNSDIRTGLSGGAFMSYLLSEKFSLKAEFNYDQLGSKTDEVENKYDYISIPVVVAYELHKGNSKAWSIDYYLGPRVSFLMKAESEYSNSELEVVDQMDDSENVDFGLQTGFVVKYPVGENKIFVNIKYGMGLLSFNKNDSDPKNKFFGVGLGYEF